MFNSIRQNQPNLVRPIVEYNSDIGLDAPFKTFDTVGRVQKKRLPGLHNYSYEDRLCHLNLPSLTKTSEDRFVLVLQIIFWSR